VKEPQNEPNFT